MLADWTDMLAHNLSYASAGRMLSCTWGPAALRCVTCARWGHIQPRRCKTPKARGRSAGKLQITSRRDQGPACTPYELNELHAVDVEVDIEVRPRAALGHDQLGEVLHEECVGRLHVARHHVLPYGLPLPQSLHRGRIPLAPTAKGGPPCISNESAPRTLYLFLHGLTFIF